MTVKDLVAIINDEKLYQYAHFYIGDPRNDDDNDIGTLMLSDGQQYGMMQVSDGIWKTYFYERGKIYAGKEVYTEDVACNKLLVYLRASKALAIEWKDKKRMPRLYNEDKWLIKKPTFWQRLFGKK